MILMPLLVFMSGFLMTLAIRHLDQSVTSYYDFVALIMVLGGTFSLGIVLLPWEYRRDIKNCLLFLIRPEKRQYHRLMADIIVILQTGRYTPPEKSPWLYHRILSDGIELAQLGYSREKIELILTERTYQTLRRWKKVASSFRNLAKYPPAFGLMGTVFGLVNIMKSLAGATDAGKLGVEMAVALVATMYGLLTANFLINPMGEILTKKAEEEEELATIAIEAVLMMVQKTPMTECLEVLNAMVPDEQRQNLTSLYEGSEAVA